MKLIQCIILLTCIQMHAFGQDKLMKDLDGDAINDTVYVDNTFSKIVCQLSSQHFRKMQSKEIEILNEQSGLTATKNGFEFFNDWMRAGYTNQFRYDSKSKKIQLIGMSRYEFGNATNDGSGESSVNLLTNNYIGNWNYFDEQHEKLISIPTIKTKMMIPKTYLETFSDQTYFDYAEKCSALYNKQKVELMKKRKNH